MPASIVNKFPSHSLTSISSCLPSLIGYGWVCICVVVTSNLIFSLSVFLSPSPFSAGRLLSYFSVA